MIGARLARAVFRRARARLVPRPVILAYHRVASVDDDPFSLCVSPTLFAQQLEWLRAERRVVSLNALLTDLEIGKPIGRVVALTFDDGYLDNFTDALPLLERHELPATFFITGAGVERGHELWWDRLARDFDDRRELTRVHDELRLLDAPEREIALQTIAERSPVVVSKPTPALMSSDHVARLSQHPLASIGAHSMTHPWLASLSFERQAAEIRESQRVLQDVIEKPIDLFAYPYGDTRSYTDATRRLLAECGFRAACTTTYAAVRGRFARYDLPRVQVANWDAAELERRLGAV
jgi:peptidoglycan/xylan/chitin deacetylase (PgdA/CDA1 family)